MIHARDDYNRIQDPQGLIPYDEPVFLLRAQDRYASIAVAFYAGLCRDSAPAVSEKSLEHSRRMEAWALKKVPDLPDAAEDEDDENDHEQWMTERTESGEFATNSKTPPEASND